MQNIQHKDIELIGKKVDPSIPKNIQRRSSLIKNILEQKDSPQESIKAFIEYVYKNHFEDRDLEVLGTLLRDSKYNKYILSLVEILDSIENDPSKLDNSNYPKIILVLLLNYVHFRLSEIQKNNDFMYYVIFACLLELDLLIELNKKGIITQKLLLLIFEYASNPRLSNHQLFGFALKKIDSLSMSEAIYGQVIKLYGRVILKKIGDRPLKMFKDMSQSEHLEGTGISGNELSILFDWLASIGNHEKHGRFSKRNISALQKISPNKEVAQFLYEECGVSCLGRYTHKILTESISILKNDRCGIIATGIYDHNGAAYEIRDILEEFRLQQKVDGLSMGLIEFSTLGDFLKRLRNILQERRRVGIMEKFKYLVLQTHGSKNSMRFGNIGYNDKYDPDFDLGEFEREVFGENIISFWRKYFIENGTLVLSSCEAGGDDGFAHQLSILLPLVTIIAPLQTGYLQNLTYRNGTVGAKFNGESKEGEGYPDVDITVKYLGGKRVD